MSKELIVSLVGDSTKFTKALDDADGKASVFSGGVGKLAAAAGGLFAGAKILDFGRDAVAAFDESAQSQAKLTQALQASPNTIGVTADAFANLNKELAKHTLADDDIIAAGEGVLATFNLTKKQIEDTIPGVVDLAAKLGTDVPGAADTVGKALLGNTKALKSLGVDGFKPTGDHAKDLSTLMGLLNEKTKGAAQSQLDAAGPGAKFQKSMDELKETVGSYLVPALEKVTAIGVKVADFFATHPTVTAFAGAIGLVAAGIWVANTAIGIFTTVTEGAATAFWAVNAAMDANPIGLLVLALAGLAAVLVVAWHNSETFRDIVTGAFDLVKGAISGAFNWVKENWPLLLGILTGPIGLAVVAITTHWTTIKNGITDVKDWIVARFGDVVGFVAGLPARIGDAAAGMFDGFKDAFREAMNWIIDKWNDFKIPGVKVAGVTVSPEVNFPNLPRFHTGGIVPGPSGADVPILAQAGERILPRGADAAGVSVIQLVVDGRVLTEVVHDGLLSKQRRTGNLGFVAA